MPDDSVTIIVRHHSGPVLDVIEDVSLGDRLKAAKEGRESLHSASLWAYLESKAADRRLAAEEAGR